MYSEHLLVFGTGTARDLSCVVPSEVPRSSRRISLMKLEYDYERTTRAPIYNWSGMASTRAGADDHRSKVFVLRDPRAEAGLMLTDRLLVFPG